MSVAVGWLQAVRGLFAACWFAGVVSTVTLPGRNPTTLHVRDESRSRRGVECSEDLMAVTTAGPPAKPRWWTARQAWALWALAVLGLVPIAWLDHLLVQVGRPDLTQLLPLLPHYVAGVGAASVGALLASRRPAHPVGWLLLVFGLATTVSGVAEGSAYYLVVTRPQDQAAAGAAALVAQLSFYPAPVAMSLIMLLTPTGSPPSPRWRWLAVLILVAPVVTALAKMFGAAALQLLPPPAPPLYSPLAVPGLTEPLGRVEGVASAVIGLAALAAAGSLVVRFRRARGTERQQLRWLALAVTTVVPVGVLIAVMTGSAWGTGIAVLSVQLAIYAAIVRYRLYDLDRIISRTLAWGLLTLLLGGGYALVVLGLGQLLGRSSSLVVAAATLAVAAVIRPARRRIQAAVDRRFNRRHYDAARTIEAFAVRLRQHIDLNSLTGELVALVEDTMQPTQASVWLRPASDSHHLLEG
jgi:MFS family permease